MEANLFGAFAKTGKSTTRVVNTNQYVKYTRVSGKEQQDNCSLETQTNAINQLCASRNYTIVAEFGGTYESAKTDGRKEFQRMLQFIRQHKGQIAGIIVYSYTRFSRTGGQGIVIAEELRQKYGVHVLSVTQPIDTREENGVLMQDMQLLFARWDNAQRKQNAIAGMKTKFRKGEWVVRPPMGYDIVRSAGIRRIVANQQGQLLKKAFQWKSEGMKNEAIVDALNALGLPMYSQKISKILANPFYCGIMVHGLLDGQVMEGNHEKLISPALFLKINTEQPAAPNKGSYQNREQEEVPLRKHILCSDCGKPFTGYVVKKKNLWYYKCRTKGCKCNKSAEAVHQNFENMLKKYCIDEKFIDPIQYQLQSYNHEKRADNADTSQQLKLRLTTIEQQLQKLDEKFYLLEQMNPDTYTRLKEKLQEEQRQITEQMQANENSKRNNQKSLLNIAASFGSHLSQCWKKGNLKLREQLQRLLFPQGVVYDKNTGTLKCKQTGLLFIPS